MQVQVLKYNYSLKDTILYFLYFFGRALFIAFSVLASVIILFIFAIVGDCAYHWHKGENVVPLFGGYVIITQSMVPTIMVNDAVLVKRSSKEELNVGDVITFKSLDQRYEGLTITHRIVGTQLLSNGDTVYRTKGDNNRLEDASLVMENSIYGKVILKLPKFGYIQQFLKTPIGFLLFIIMPIILIILLNYQNIKDKLKLKN